MIARDFSDENENERDNIEEWSYWDEREAQNVHLPSFDPYAYHNAIFDDGDDHYGLRERCSHCGEYVSAVKMRTFDDYDGSVLWSGCEDCLLALLRWAMYRPE